EAVEQYRKAIITQWRRAKFDDAEGERSLSEPELRAYYDAHRAEYEKPQRARPGQAPTEGRSFEAAEPDVRARLWEERKGKLYEDFVKTLTEQAHIKIDDDELAKVNRGSSEEAPQPASVVPRTSLDEQLRTTLPPYRESPADMTGPLVATFAGHKIPTAELKRYFEEQSPFVRAHYKSEESKKALLKDLIEAQLLVDEGLKGGFDQDPLAIEHFQRSMITEWMAAKFNETQGEQSLSEADLHAYYDAHLDDYQ